MRDTDGDALQDQRSGTSKHPAKGQSAEMGRTERDPEGDVAEVVSPDPSEDAVSNKRAAAATEKSEAVTDEPPPTSAPDTSQASTRDRASQGDADDSKGAYGASGPVPPVLPGPASARRPVDHNTMLPARQLQFLLVAFLLIGVASIYGYSQVAYRPPPAESNSSAPRFVIEVPAQVEELNFAIDERATRIEAQVADWNEATGTITVRSEQPNYPVRLLEVDGTRNSPTGGESEASWEVVERAPDAVRLQPKGDGTLLNVTITLLNGTDTAANQFRYVRTGRVDVISIAGKLPTRASGTLTIDVGSYSLDRIITAAASEPGISQGADAQYNLTVANLSGVWTDALPVPAVSLDLVDVGRQRSSDANLLVIGAVLGVLGGLFVEILLTLAHLLYFRSSAQSPAGEWLARKASE